VKYLYIIDYWVPFPQSEYGGMITLIAEDDTDAFGIISNEEQLNSYEAYSSKIMEKILTAQKFELVENYQSGILEVFTT